MADNIRNFNDYKKSDRRKKEKIDEFATEEINSIEIQDPLDFLTADEREEYYRTQHAAMDKERESLLEDSPEFYFDEDEEPVRPEPEKKRERAPKQERPAKKKAEPKNEKKRAPEPQKEKQRAIRKRAREEYEDYEDEDNESGIDPMLIVRISSIITGIIILVLIGMIFKAKVYDKYLIPNPDEEKTEVEVGELAGYTKTDDKIVTTADLNLRNTPSTASDSFIVVQVPQGTVLDRVAVSDDGEWAQVRYENQLLFCVMKYASVQE